MTNSQTVSLIGPTQMAPQSTPPPPVNELWFIDAQAMFQVIYVEMSYESFKKC